MAEVANKFSHITITATSEAEQTIALRKPNRKKLITLEMNIHNRFMSTVELRNG